jgi:prephenate dehydratase
MENADNKIGWLGPLGTFTEEAAVKYCSEAGVGCDLVPYRTVSKGFRAVESGEVSKGVVPIENFLNGHVMETLDNLYKSELQIQVALVLPVRHCLAVNPDVKDVKIIKSHPQALAQCSDYLDVNYPDAVRVDASSTASAMKEVVGGVENGAAIGSEVAAKKYGLKILEREIGNNDNNKTMFVVIGKGESQRSERSRTSLVVVPSINRPGVLNGILSNFAAERVDLKFIQSRPDGEGNYIFYVDIEGHIEDENVKRVLEKLSDDSVIKVLGSYPYVSLSGV